MPRLAYLALFYLTIFSSFFLFSKCAPNILMGILLICRIPIVETKWRWIQSKFFKNFTAICFSDKISIGKVEKITKKKWNIGGTDGWKKAFSAPLFHFALVFLNFPVWILSDRQMDSEFSKNSSRNSDQYFFRAISN